MSNDAELDILKRHVEQLGEHFDSVHVFCTRFESGDEGGTVNANWGSGNWFARYGQIKSWIVKREQEERNEVTPEN